MERNAANNYVNGDHCWFYSSDFTDAGTTANLMFYNLHGVSQGENIIPITL